VFLLLALEGDSAHSCACHKPTEGGIPLASVQVSIKQTPACEFLVSAPVLIYAHGGQKLAVQSKYLLVSKVPQVVQGTCKATALIPIHYFLVSLCCHLSK